MHTLMVIGAGLVLLAVMLAIAAIRGGMGSPAMRSAARAFIPVWLLAAAANMYVGVTQAGYTIAQELPILVLVFAVPAGLAYVLSRLLTPR
ncbi:MAG: hypothetical protein NW223_09995 [Hyphomicrobiaceae bacterium]|nr:hypothetical protein [Hyphomicrobiaceae bacterium]